jgi:lactoylglutathione lyase
MRIGNVGIFVKDLAGASKFFEDYFGATLLKTYNEEESNYYSDILQLDEGAWIELMTKPEIVDAPKDPNRTGLAHICIKVNSRPELDHIIQKFKRDGYKIQYEPSNPTGGGEVRAVTFEDIVLEVNYTPEA